MTGIHNTHNIIDIIDFETVKIWSFAIMCNLFANTNISDILMVIVTSEPTMTDKELLELIKLYLSCISIASACIYSIAKTIMLYKERDKIKQIENDGIKSTK